MKTSRTDLIFLPGFGYRATVFSHLSSYFHNHNLHFSELPRAHDCSALTAFASSLPCGAVLAGWSLGGLVAIDLCAKFPDRFRKLVLITSLPKFSADAEWTAIHPERIASLRKALQQDTQTAAGEFQKLVCFPSTSRMARAHFTAHAETDSALLQHQLHYLTSADLRSAFSSLTQPVLAISGSHDAVIPAEMIAAHIIHGAGHALLFTHAAEMCERINEFLEQP